eukprot:6200586-Pleurochrysis_carterae.AAC.5
MGTRATVIVSDLSCKLRSNAFVLRRARVLRWRRRRAIDVPNTSDASVLSHSAGIHRDPVYAASPDQKLQPGRLVCPVKQTALGEAASGVRALLSASQWAHAADESSKNHCFKLVC